MHQTVSLIVHLPLLNVNMPGSSAIVLSEAARVIRLDFIPLSGVFDSVDLGNANKSLSSLMHQNGYEATSILLNLTPLLAMYLVLFIVSLIAKCTDSTHVTSDEKKEKPMINGRTDVRYLSAAQKTFNVFFRFKFTIFLELFITIFINLKAVSAPTRLFEF